MSTKLCMLSMVFASFLGAQTFSVGVKGGGLLTEPAERSASGSRYVVGPMFELGLGPRVGVEVNALYSRFRTSGVGRGTDGHLVEFPVLGKYYFADRDASLRPYAAAGFSVRNIWFDGSGSRLGRGSVNATEPGTGAVVGGGAAFRFSFLTLSPEVRYTRWGGYNYPATNPNQVQALLGITF